MAAAGMKVVERRIRWHQPSFDAGYFTLEFLVRSCSYMRCTDIRDRIYALLSLLGPQASGQFGIVPDYTKSASELFSDLITLHRQLYSAKIKSFVNGRRDWAFDLRSILQLSDSDEVVQQVLAEVWMESNKDDYLVYQSAQHDRRCFGQPACTRTFSQMR
ncbi:hypothetical protein EK21DRAFT_90430 [Setomelanomma holmii]|uniref:Uncharacterized protein n=1 Tax=Setomelanomma holmii TaxID=210430 RepID=A0A9P4H5Y7_9PLEO|nr:hypothetical protein EK21DRAFT_90430 [Setomelanomma holmii]